MSKVEELQRKKQERGERKKNWELWKKTKAMHWKKTSTDYSKWEYFTDSSDTEEEDQDPVTPEDDPQFKALKKDMDERAARIKVKSKKAQALKTKANAFMKKKNYLKAIELYSEAIELTKSNKYLWTNRALAHLRRGDPDSCVADCTKILEYCDVLEDGYTKSRDPCFKAFARRAMAYKDLKQFDNALEDVAECQKLFPEDESAKLLKQEILDLKAKNDKAEEMKKEIMDSDKMRAVFKGNEDLKKVIDEFVKFNDAKLGEEDGTKQAMIDMDYSVMTKIKQKEDFMVYFYNIRGLEALKRVFKTRAYTSNVTKGKTNFITFLQIVLKDNAFFKEEIVKNNFVRIIAKRITKELNSYVEHLDQEIDDEAEAGEYDQMRLLEVEEFLEVLVSLTETRSCRLYLREKSHILTPIFKIFYERLLRLFKSIHSLLSSILTLFGNLLISETGVKRNDIKDLLVQNYLPSLFTSIGILLTQKSLKYMELKNSCLAFISNLMIHPEVRNFAIKDLYKTSSEYTKREIKVAEYEEAKLLFFLEKLFTDVHQITDKSMNKYKKLGHKTVKFFENSSSLVLNLSHGIKDQMKANKISLMINSKGFCASWFVMIKAVMASPSFPSRDLLICRGLSAIFRYYIKGAFKHGIQDEALLKKRDTEIDIFLAKLASYFKTENIQDEVKLEIVHQIAKIIVKFHQKEELIFIEKIFKLLRRSKEAYTVMITIINEGSEKNLAR